jgi:prophage regulatory protein
MVAPAAPIPDPEGDELNSRTPVLIAVDDLARILDVSTRTVWRLLSAGKIVRPVRLGGAVRWRYTEVRHWIDQRCPELPPPKPR